MARPLKVQAQQIQQTIQQVEYFDMRRTAFHHVYSVDLSPDKSKQFKDLLILKKRLNGTLHYVDISLCDNIDKSRIKERVTSVHADKYECWELFMQKVLNNGKNALEYFRQMEKILEAPGTNMSSLTGSLSDVRADQSTGIIGSDYTKVNSGALN